MLKAPHNTGINPIHLIAGIGSRKNQIPRDIDKALIIHTNQSGIHLKEHSR